MKHYGIIRPAVSAVTTNCGYWIGNLCGKGYFEDSAYKKEQVECDKCLEILTAHELLQEALSND